MAKRSPAYSKAIVTIAVGPGFAARWHSICEPRWRRYCERWGYDLVCIEEPLDTSERARRRSPAWQKCLILGQPFAQRYEQVVWVDADVLPNPEAPSVVSSVPIDRVGAVDEYSMPTREIHSRTLAKLYRRWDAEGLRYVHNLTAAEYYSNFGLSPAFEAVVQTGLMVLSPRHHRELLEDVYARYEDRGPGFNYEMRPLSFELLRAGVVTWLDPRFNYIWGHYKALHFPFLVTHPRHPRAAKYAARALADVHFMHFTGSLDEMGPAAAAPPPSPLRRVPGRSSRQSGLRTPVVMLVYARPELTRGLVEIVRAARPSKLLVVADGPSGADEAERCEQTREVVAEAGFDCEVLTNYAERSLGLKRRFETGLDWAFGLVDEAIVLEDDCHPHPTFFGFCEELLARYRDDPRVTTISGSNFGQGADIADASYFFSRYPLIWGWATWARAWRHYSTDLAVWPERRERGWLEELFDDPQAVQYWTYIFDRRRALEDTWDTGWLFGSWVAEGLSAVPRRNLVTNVGFGEHATNTRVEFRGLFSDVPAVAADWPLRHPPRVERDVEADAFLEDVLFSGNLGRLFERIRSFRPEPASR
jgi:hypothetical protein